MDYQNIYDYCKDISQNIGVSVKFVHTDKSWLNLIEPNKAITCWSLPFTSSHTFGIDNPILRTWTIPIIFYQQDQSSGSYDANNDTGMQESIRTVSITDRSVERFIRLFSENTITPELERASDMLTITGATTDVAIRDTAQQLTGTFLTLTVQFSDNFNYCCE